MPFIDIDAKNRIEELKANDPLFASNFSETEKEFNIISKVIERRNKLGFTQSDVAKRIGVRQQFVSKLETKGQSPTLRSFIKVASALGMEIQLVEKSMPKLDVVAKQPTKPLRVSHNKV